MKGYVHIITDANRGTLGPAIDESSIQITSSERLHLDAEINHEQD